MSRALDLLKKYNPSFNGRDNAGIDNFHMPHIVLDWVVDNVSNINYTLETGCGHTTAFFGALAELHYCFSPFSEEFNLVRSWAEQHSLPFNAEFVQGKSQYQLNDYEFPAFEMFDIVLLDGDHSFPVPSMDWYLVSDYIKTGGYLIVDNVEIPACKDLTNFLELEPKWQLEKTFKIDSINWEAKVFKCISNKKTWDILSFQDQPYNYDKG